MHGLTRFAAGRRRWCLLLAAGAAAATGAAPVLAAAVADALQRPSLPVRQPAQAVLLAGGAAGGRLVAVGERGIVALSDDQGRSWRQAQVPVSVTLTAVRFADARHGAAVGHGGTVLVTGDGGEHWQLRMDGRRLAALVLAAAQAAGEPRALKEAQRLVEEGADKPLLDLLVTEANRIVAVGAYGLALATEDGGATWAAWNGRLDNPKSLHLNAIRRRGDAIVIAGEQGLLLRSDDGGATFRRVNSPYAGSFFTAELLPDGGVLAAGLRGNAWRSDARMAAWSQLASPIPASFTASALRPDGTLLLASQAGFVLALRGDKLVPLHTTPLPPVNALLERAGAPPLALTVQGAMPLPAGTSPGTPK